MMLEEHDRKHNQASGRLIVARWPPSPGVRGVSDLNRAAAVDGSRLRVTCVSKAHLQGPYYLQQPTPDNLRITPK